MAHSVQRVFYVSAQRSWQALERTHLRRCFEVRTDLANGKQADFIPDEGHASKPHHRLDTVMEIGI